MTSDTAKHMNLQDAIDEFLTYLSAQIVLGNHSPRTKIAYEQDFAHLLAVLGAVPLDAISDTTVDAYCMALGAYVSRRSGKNLSPHTINKRLSSFRRLLNFCIQRGHISSAPEIQVIKADVDVDAKTIPLDHLHKIHAYAKTKPLNRERDTFIVVALVDFGPRVSEIARLRIADVDFVERTATLHRKGGHVQTVPVSTLFLSALQAWLDVRPDCDHDFVLCGTNRLDHSPMLPSGIGQAFRRMAIKAASKSWGPHAVRHCWISEMLNNTDTPPKVVQDLAGHRQFRTTERYARQDLSAQRRAVERHQLLDAEDQGKDQKGMKPQGIGDVHLN